MHSVETLQVPLIWTTHGNLPAHTLRQEVEWRVLPDQVQFIERYWLGDEVVKESTHVRILEGVTVFGDATV